MNEMKRNSKGQYTKPASPKKLAAYWSAAAVSAVILYGCGAAVMATMGSFRSCEANSAGLFVRNCGKLNLTPSDLVILVVFIAAAVLCVSLFTAAWRITKRKAV